MAEIKNIVFDLGGVLIDIDYNKTRIAFEDLGFKNFEAMYSQYTVDKLFDLLETGKIDEASFFKTLLKQQPHLLQENIRTAWNAMLLNFRKESFDYLEILKHKYQLFLLSNTNAIHHAAFNAVFQEQTGYNSLNDFFIKAYYSNEVGMRKPDRNIFEFILEDAGIKAGETLFIDDSYNNIETAQQLGFKTYLLKPGEKIETLNYE